MTHGLETDAFDRVLKNGGLYQDELEAVPPSTSVKSKEVTSTIQLPVQPDGGWGWVVCAASMICGGTVGSLFATFSILYVSMLQVYDKGDSYISVKTGMRS